MSARDEPGLPASDREEFLGQLGAEGASSYTLRSYRLGLADFDAWLRAQGRLLVDVSRVDVAAYVDGFARGDGPADRSRRAGPRAPRTVNHRVSVLASFFAFLIRRDGDHGGPFAGRWSPVPEAGPAGVAHGMPGRDRPGRRGRGELRRRVPRRLPAELEPDLVRSFIEVAGSWRDKAILLLLATTGQRIGDWSDVHGRHGILGMSLSDFDRRRSAVVVRLKGARDEHRVPVVGEFWDVFDRYVGEERGDPGVDAAWVGFRRGRGRPLGYAGFEAALRYAAAKADVKVTAHMFRHNVAQHVAETSGLKVAQDLLGHQHITTTADTYAHVDHAALVDAVAGMESRRRARNVRTDDRPATAGTAYVFHYDVFTIEVLDSIAAPRLGTEEQR